MSNATDINFQPVRTVRLPAREIARILDDLDRANPGGNRARRDSRYCYRVPEIVVYMQQPGFPAPKAFIVLTRNLSARGLSFLHGGFVHPGTMCVVQLITTKGTQQKVLGSVRRCRYIESNVHEVAVQFKSAIDPTKFCSDAVRLRVLLAEADPALAKLAGLHLDRLNCDIEQASDGELALAMSAQGNYDLILLDANLSKCDGYAAATRMRKSGFIGAIVLGTDNNGGEDRNRALEAGCDRNLVKPYTAEDLSELMASLHSEPIFSSFRNDADMTELISEFISKLPAKLGSLEKSLAARDAGALRSLISELKIESRGFGFAPIADLAAKIEESMAMTSVDSAVPQVRSLIRLCTQARPAPRA